jgi:hypothetical protein
VQVSGPSPAPPPSGPAAPAVSETSADAAPAAVRETSAAAPAAVREASAEAVATPSQVAPAPPPQPPPAQPAIPAAGPTGTPVSDRRSPWPGRVAAAMLLAGGLNVLLGVILPTINGDEDKIGTITIQIAVYAASWIFLAGAPGEATRGRRIMLAIVGAWALLLFAWLVSERPVYVEYWKIRDTRLYLFWLVAGALEIGAALLGGSRPTRRLELVSAGLTVAFGALILYLVNQEADQPWLVGSFSLYFIALGVTWILIGWKRRRAAGAG